MSSTAPNDGYISPLNLIPDANLDAIARRLLPEIQVFYAGAEGKRFLKNEEKEHGIT